MQPNTIQRFALNATDFPNGSTGVPFMGGFVQLFPGAILPDPAAVMAYVIPAPPPLVPDLATQLAAALINNGTLQPTDINAATLASVNTTLQATGQATIAITAKLQGA